MLRLRYGWRVKSISQRELRNQSGEIVRGLARGESFRLTSRGVPVGVVTPLDRTVLEELTLRPGTQVMSFPAGASRSERVTDVLDEMRSER